MGLADGVPLPVSTPWVAARFASVAHAGKKEALMKVSKQRYVLVSDSQSPCQ
jgi:hypothetical protein